MVKDKCSTCGKELYAIYRSPFSPVHCENGHKWKIKYNKQKEFRDGRWHIVSVEEILIPWEGK